ncbi:MAG TPA: hypothetical protein QF753_17250 [Victivallales bacterium]|nr:hypothetical protein [Victivallales bacterium]|tara:strand:- start:12 stop:362 length:351 start_codon:yes stop_codon:yes gene_type:complete
MQKIDDDVDLMINTGSAIEESKGMTMYLQGDLFIPMIVAVLASMFFIGFMILISGMPIIISLVLGSTPAWLAGLYIAVFENNKPPNYRHDLIDRWLGNESADANPVQNKCVYVRRK